MRDHDEAEALARRTTEPALGIDRTGLRKICPRCGRGGWVFLGTYSDVQVLAIIVWDGPPRGGGEFDCDRASTGDLYRATFGCGYDDAPLEGR